MTPDQITRLTLLLSMTALTGSENQELAFLKSIATPGELATASGEEQSEDEGGKGEEEEGEEESPSPATTAEPAATKPGFLDHALAMGTSKGDLLVRNRDLAKNVGSLTAELQQANVRSASLSKELASLKTTLSGVQAELAEAQSQAGTLSGKVTEELAGIGVPDKDLPAASSSEKGALSSLSKDQLEDELAKLETMQEKADFLAKYEQATATR